MDARFARFARCAELLDKKSGDLSSQVKSCHVMSRLLRRLSSPPLLASRAPSIGFPNRFGLLITYPDSDLT